ncbi:MAG: hypothetical protein KY464_02290 [Gemmatimonadetes bacterium]|nr:hypothetical protein [Gemmatimonadota bacterium]
MNPSFLSRSRACAAVAVTLMVLASCDDPAEMAKEVADAQGDCSQDSLRVSSETCVRMFERYAGMATEAIHTYIGGMKAMDQALKRLPPPNFDTAGLGRAFTPGAAPPDSLNPSPSSSESARRRRYAQEENGGYLGSAPNDQASRWDEPYGPYDPDGYEADDYSSQGYEVEGYEEDPRGYARDIRPPPRYEDPRLIDARPRQATQPERRPGVLLPPKARLGRPWLGEPQRRLDPRLQPEDDEMRDEREQRDERDERPRR